MQLTQLDRLITQYQTVQGWFDVALLNGIGITDDIANSVVLVMPDNDYDVVAIQVQTPADLGIIGKQAKKKNQTPIDFFLQNSGDMQAVIQMALLNGIGITDDIADGSELFAQVFSKDVVNYFKKGVVDIVTITPATETILVGIGYMQIETSFKVS